MRVVVTRPQPDANRTASALRSRGHEVLVVPLMRIEPIAADLSGQWSGVIITSANALGAIEPSAVASLRASPLFAVGHRSAAAAHETGFTDIQSAEGDVNALVRLIAERHLNRSSPLLYLAGEDRAGDLVRDLSSHGIAVEMRVVYRSFTLPFPSALIAALAAGEVDAVLHFSKRSAENYLAGAIAAGIGAQSLAVRHVCLSEQISKPLAMAGAHDIAIAAQPQEAVMFELLAPPFHSDGAIR